MLKKGQTWLSKDTGNVWIVIGVQGNTIGVQRINGVWDKSLTYYWRREIFDNPLMELQP